MGSKSKSFSSDEEEHSAVEEEEEESSSLGRALEKLNLGPKKQNKKKLLVLSLNGLLIHRVHRADSAMIPRNRRPDGIYDGTRYVYRRPFLEQFIQFCLERFEVALWSSAIERNIDGVLGCSFMRLKKRFLFIWDQNKCTDYGFKALEKKNKPLFFKELKEIWSSSTIGARFFESNILLIDDKPYKALLNPPNTGIFPETYDPQDITDDCLDPMGELTMYLDGLAEAEDVPSYVKNHPFGQPPIGPGHPDWRFYSNVIRRIKG